MRMGNLGITRHISLEDEYIDRLQPYVDKHSGNLAAAIRDLIKEAGKNENRGRSSAVDQSLLNWMIREIDDKLVPPEILNEFLDPLIMNSMNELEIYFNRMLAGANWGVHITLKYDDDMVPGEMIAEICGDPQKTKFVAGILTQYLIYNSLKKKPLEIKYIIDTNEGLKVELSGSNNKDALRSLGACFGKTDELLRTIRSRQAFWTSVFSRHILSNYSMVTLHRNYFEDLLDGKIPAWENIIETYAKKPIQEIPLSELLHIIKEVFETSKIVEKVEIDKDTIILFHNYRDKQAVEKLRKSFHSLLESNGHMYDARATSNIIVLTHRKDVGIMINEVVDSMSRSSNKLDQELLLFIGFLKGLEDIPDIPISLSSLGRRIGKSLMQKYEQEKPILSWTLENFQEAMQSIDNRLHRESEWKSEGKDLLYTIRKCNIAGNGNTFDNYDNYVCHTMRETFKGALNYVFGNKAQMYTKHLLTHGDNFCEVVIKLL